MDKKQKGGGGERERRLEALITCWPIGVCRANDCNDIGDDAKLPPPARLMPPNLEEKGKGGATKKTITIQQGCVVSHGRFETTYVRLGTKMRQQANDQTHDDFGL